MKITNLFRRLTYGATPRMWARFLALDKAYSRIVAYSWRERRIRQVGPETIPWHVAVLLGTFHRKHIFFETSRPRIRDILHDLQTMGNRLKWRWHFRNEERSSSYIKVPRRIQPYTDITPPELNAWLHQFRFEVVSHCNRAIAAFRNPAHRPSNTPKLLIEAARWLANSRWSVQFSDKDHILVLIPRSDVHEMVASQVESSPCYRAADPGLAKAHHIALTQLVPRVAREIELYFGPPNISRAIASTAHVDIDYFVRKLGFTVKTHKLPNEVGLRLLHTGPKIFMLGPLGQWFKNWCQSKLQKLGAYHLVPNSAAVTSALRGRVYSHGVVGAKLDIDEYFLTGTPKELIDIVLQSCDTPEEKTLIPKVMELLLSNQFVASRNGQSISQVTRGAGMGLNFAGELADLTLCLLAERSPTRSLRNPCLLYYARFKDDAIALFKDWPSIWKPWLGRYVKNCLPYKVRVEKISREWLPFLDISVHFAFDGSCSRVLTAPFRKPSANKIPLASDSGHTPSIHLAWPKNEFARIRSQCISEQHFLVHRQRLISEFAENGESATFLEHISSDRVRTRKLHDEVPIWFVTKFHPILYAPLARAIKKVSPNILLLKAAFESREAPRIRLSFRSHAEGVAKLLRSVTSEGGA